MVGGRVGCGGENVCRTNLEVCSKGHNHEVDFIPVNFYWENQNITLVVNSAFWRVAPLTAPMFGTRGTKKEAKLYFPCD